MRLSKCVWKVLNLQASKHKGRVGKVGTKATYFFNGIVSLLRKVPQFMAHIKPIIAMNKALRFREQIMGQGLNLLLKERPKPGLV